MVTALGEGVDETVPRPILNGMLRSIDPPFLTVDHVVVCRGTRQSEGFLETAHQIRAAIDDGEWVGHVLHDEGHIDRIHPPICSVHTQADGVIPRVCPRGLRPGAIEFVLTIGIQIPFTWWAAAIASAVLGFPRFLSSLYSSFLT